MGKSVMTPESKDLIYEERLKEMSMTTLKESRERGDLMKIWKQIEKIKY